MIVAILFSVTFVAAAITILADYRGKRSIVYIFRPLTMLFIIGIALLGEQGAGRQYQITVIGGLLFSLAGDIFMMLRRKRFTAGLAAFLAANLFYIRAFLTGLRLQFSTWPLIPLLIYAFVMVWILYPRLGKMKIPVMIYVLVIISMIRLAAERYLQFHETGPFLAFSGAVFFIFSDTVLALNRFVRPFKAAQAIILSTYFLAQCLIALSV